MTRRAQIFLALSLFSGPAATAQICGQVDGQPLIGYRALPGNVSGSINCNGQACYTPEIFEVRYETRPIGCDPSDGTCSIRAFVPADIRGNRNNQSQFALGNLVFEWTSPEGEDGGSCGAGSNLSAEKTETWIQIGGFSCGSSFPAGGVYSLRVRVCGAPPGFPDPCVKTKSTLVDLTGPTIAAAVCPDPPRPWSCNEKNSCRSGCMGPNGSGAAGSGAGGSSAAGGGPGLGGRIFGGGAYLRYQAGGLGAAYLHQPSGAAADGSAGVRHELTMTGANAAPWRANLQSAETRAERLTNAWGRYFPGLEVRAVETPGIDDVLRPVQVNAEFSVPGFAQAADGAARFQVFGYRTQLVRALAPQARREHDIDLSTPATEVHTIEYELPRGYTFARVPDGADFEIPAARFQLKITTEGQSRARVESRLEYRNNRIPAADYRAFREFLRQVDAALGQTFEVRPGR